MDKIEVKEKTTFIEFYKKYSFMFNCAILSVLFLANCFLPWFTFIAHSFLLALVLICNIKNAISYLFFCFVFNSLNLPASAILFALCVAAMMVKLIIIKYKENKSDFKIRTITLIIYLIFVAYIIMPIGRNVGSSYFQKVFYLSGAPILLYLFAKFSDEFNLRHNLRILLYGLLVACGLSLLEPISIHLQTIIEDHYVDGLYRYPAVFINPNTLALTCEMCLSLMAYFIIKNKAEFKDTIIFLLFLFIGFFTLSKTFMIISCFNLIVLGIFSIKERSKNVAILFIGFIVGLGVVMLIRPKIILTWTSRLFNAGEGETTLYGLLNKLTTGRYELWVAYITSMCNNPLAFVFGNGLSAPILLEWTPHNMYICVLYQIGFVGIALCVATIVLFFKDARRGFPKLSKAYLVPLIAFALLAFVEDLMFFLY